jgi:hypothetical protein
MRKRGKTGFNQALIYIHPFSPLSPQSFVAKKKLFLVRKNEGGGDMPQVTPMT